jgi:hypothetical protein
MEGKRMDTSVHRMGGAADTKPHDLWFWVVAIVAAAATLGGVLGSGALPQLPLPQLPLPVLPDRASQATSALASEGLRVWEQARDAIVASIPGARSCRVVLGFGQLQALIGRAIVGDCIEDERFDPTWDVAVQATTSGLFVFRRVDGTVAFTDGYRTWLLGPAGFQRRFNTQRYCWEPDAEPRACLRS